MTGLIEQLHSAAEHTGTDVGSMFEQVIKTAYQDFLKPGDYAVDVGAHKGFHLFPMAKAVGKKGRIYAFEPIAPLYDRLHYSILKKKLRHIRLFNLALGDTVGTVAFSYFENRPAYSGLQQRPTPFDAEDGGLRNIEVECGLLDQKMPWFKKISFVKMDIEGGEYRALLGAERMLKKSRPIIIFENGQGQSAKDYGYTADDFFSLFERHDMSVFLLSGAPFKRENWSENLKCWEYVALPNEKVFMAEYFAGYCKQALAVTTKNHGS